MMNKVFKGQTGRMLEVYMDNMIVKSKTDIDHAADLTEVFGEVRKHNMRFNPRNEPLASGQESFSISS